MSQQLTYCVSGRADELDIGPRIDGPVHLAVEFFSFDKEQPSREQLKRE